MTTTTRAVQTTEQKARAAANGCHLIKWYDGKVSSVWRYPTAKDVEQAADEHEAFQFRFRQRYLDANLTPPARPWKLEII